MVQRVCGVMLTMTTYGTWLRGDQRGWVDDGRILPPDPILESADQARMAHPTYRFDVQRWFEIGSALGQSLIDRMAQRILALTVQCWHVHLVVADSDRHIAEVVKCAKNAVRYCLRPGRPIWTDGYDRRFCFDAVSLRTRIAYVERHNLECVLRGPGRSSSATTACLSPRH